MMDRPEHPATLNPIETDQLAPTEFEVEWGGVHVPPDVLAPHYACVGSSGSGKTLLLRLLMRPVLANLHFQRTLIVDPKRELLPYLLSLGLSPQLIVNMDPFAANSATWDMAADVRTPAQAKQLAEILAPLDQQARDPIWSTVARRTTQIVILTFIQRADLRWTLRDIVEACTDFENLKTVLQATPQGKRHYASYFIRPKATAASLFSTTASKLEAFTELAALAEHAEYKVSLDKWVRSCSVLMLVNDDEHAETLRPLNRAIMQRISQLLLIKDEYPADKTWVFVDELREVGKLDGLRQLLNKGRSKGAHVVLGFQDKQGLNAVYGTDEAKELVGLCGNLAVLNLMNPETAEWAAKVFGTYEWQERATSTSIDHEGKESETTSYRLSTRAAFLPQEFRMMPLASYQHGLSGAFASPGIGIWTERLSPPYLQARLPPAAASAEHKQARPPEHQVLAPWDADDLARLGLDAAASSSQGDTSQPQAPLRPLDLD